MRAAAPSRLMLAVIGAAAFAVAAAGCGGSTRSTPTTSVAPQAGGIYRVGWENAFGFSDNLDPTGEYVSDGIGLLSNLLDRTLVGYDHVGGPAGNTLVPDLATSLPTPTDGGKTYTFHLKSGIRFGPPVGREITSRDVLYALERIARPANHAAYGFYYDVIKGLTAYGAGKASTISGIATPNPRTIVFHLVRPTGDFLYRLSMPAAGPIPVEVARCFEGQPGKYGNYLVSTGPYMIEGAATQNDASCSSLKRLSGFQETQLTLVRNPDYSAKTDTPAARQNLPDEFLFQVDSSPVDILNRVESGQLDDETATIPPEVMKHYSTDPALKHLFHQSSGDRTWYLSMNLTQPPFDDVHVRRAMNWIIDKTGLRQSWGGPTAGMIANHIVPDTIFDGKLDGYAPYATPGDHGSVAKARQAMRGSRYSTGNDGMCDASVCKNVLMISDTRGVDPGMVATIEQDARKIGITFTVHAINGAYPTIQTPSKNIPLAERPGWAKDYADAGTFFNPLFDGRTIIPAGNANGSLVGITPAQCKSLKVTGDCTNVPSVNADLDRCGALSGAPRVTCYEALDRKLMTQIVPWVPYLTSYATHITSPEVTAWSFDQFSGTIGYAHVAVAAGASS